MWQEQLHRNFDALAGALMLCVGDDGFICGKYCTHPNLNIKVGCCCMSSIHLDCFYFVQESTPWPIFPTPFLFLACTRFGARICRFCKDNSPSHSKPYEEEFLQFRNFRASDINIGVFGWISQFAVRFHRSFNGFCLQCGSLMTALRVRRLFFLLAQCCRVWFFVVGVLEFPFMWGLCCLNVMST